MLMARRQSDCVENEKPKRTRRCASRVESGNGNGLN